MSIRWWTRGVTRRHAGRGTKDPYPIDALPTCNHALSVCQKDIECQRIYDKFKSDCKVRDGKCHMEDREQCLESWSQIRMTPMFGCICPNNHFKKRCERIFSLVNHNPCLVRSAPSWALAHHFYTSWTSDSDERLKADNYPSVSTMFARESSHAKEMLEAESTSVT
ncbi:hypothetical protein GE061_000383 [Apolygus lucorum]|uniref:GDNF/GAS1 domain-containing protein n=1 Tax=Apolygus lucorum TaxID=248454 RepID=A0A8S9Y6W0_APOLU|nr:hypothetical protein GE061_000383 [Apolygus lucorum]